MKIRYPVIFLFICICMTLILCLTVCLTACADKNEDGNTVPAVPTDSNGKTADGTETPAEIPDKIIAPIDLPDENFNGRSFNIITPSYDSPALYQMFVSQVEDGEIINDAVYKRTVIIEDRYNIKINQTTNDGPAGKAQKSIKAGNDDYNLIVERAWASFPLANSGMYENMYEIPYVSDSLSEKKPWWNAALVRDMTINGKLYFNGGDIIMADKMLVYMTLFNKKLFAENNIEYPYKYVLDGTWTLDKMFSITRGLNKDINGDGKLDESDRWGLMAEYSTAQRLYASAGEKMIRTDNGGYAQFSMNTQRSLAVIDKIMPYMLDGESMLKAEDMKNPSNGYSGVYFQDDRIFMWMATMENIIHGNLRAMPTDFGIVPTPKFDEYQEQYCTFMEMSAYMLSIPVTTDFAFTGLITEALAYESVSTVTPAFYDLTLRVKNTRDDESEAMLDIIFNNRNYDIGTFNTNLSVYDIFYSAVADKKTSLVSLMDSRGGKINAAIDKFNADY